MRKRIREGYISSLHLEWNDASWVFFRFALFVVLAILSDEAAAAVEAVSDHE